MWQSIAAHTLLFASLAHRVSLLLDCERLLAEMGRIRLLIDMNARIVERFGC